VILVGTFLNRFLFPTKTAFEKDFIQLVRLGSFRLMIKPMKGIFMNALGDEVIAFV